MAFIRIVTLLLVVWIGQPLMGQDRLPHPSHRLIPLSGDQKAPSLKDFLTPEMLELQREYRRLRAEERRRQLPSNPLPRRNRTRQQIEQQEEWTESLNSNLPPVQADDLQKEHADVLQQLQKKLPKNIADTLKPQAVPFDPENKTSPWSVAAEVKQAMDHLQAEADERHQEALKLYHEVWPDDNIPPGEWIQKVQPYINDAVIEQIKEAKREFEAQQQVDSETPGGSKLSSNSESPLTESTTKSKGDSRQLLDSLMKSIDKQGTDWLKSKPQEESSSSWWTKLKETTRDRVSKLNRRMTRHSREVTQRNTQRSQQFVSSLPDVRNMDVNPGTFSVSWNLLGLLLLIVLGMLYVFHWRKGEPGQEAVVSEFVFPRSIHDSESLLMAFHALGQQLGGWQSRFWHHRTLIQRLSGDRSTESDTLAQLYEKARYKPNRVLSSHEVDEARRILSQLQQRLHAS